MISNSNLFSYLLTEYIEKKTAESILKSVKEYEYDISNNRLAINNINRFNFNNALEIALQHIKYSDNILDICLQLKMRIKTRKMLKEKSYALDLIATTKEIESLEEIIQMTNKTEKANKKASLIKEKMLEKEKELDFVKIDYETVEVFVTSAINLREASYAYYQAVKQTNNNIEKN